jgi:hypothetical protein
MHKLKRREKLPVIDHMARNLSGNLGDMPKALTFIKRMGVQHAVNIFRDSPGRFMKLIQNA